MKKKLIIILINLFFIKSLSLKNDDLVQRLIDYNHSQTRTNQDFLEITRKFEQKGSFRRYDDLANIYYIKLKRLMKIYIDGYVGKYRAIPIQAPNSMNQS